MKYIYLFLLCAVYVAIGQSFDNFQRPLAKVIIVGNEKTETRVIERELLFTKGDVLSDSLLKASRDRLENLWLFNRVEFFPLDNGDSVSLLISVTERLYIFPFPEYKVEERDWGKLTYGLGIAHENFRGLNEKIYLSALFGYRPGYKFYYRNPWMGEEAHLTGSLFLQRYTLPNSLEDFDEKHLYGAASLGKYWTRNVYTSVTLFGDDISVAAADAPFLESEKRQETNLGFFISHTIDSRDLYAYPSRGYFIELFYKQGGLFNRAISYAKYHADLRKYISWKQLIFAGRLYVQSSNGHLPVYDPIYFGFLERIRGHFKEKVIGNHLFSGGLALRFPLLKTQYFNTPSSILPDASTRNLKFGINGGLFVESGLAWKNSDQFASENLMTGFGAGLHFLLPYIEVLRTDIAFNEKWEHEFIIEILMPF